MNCISTTRVIASTARLLTLTLAVVLATSIVAVSTATAEPEFRPASGTWVGTDGVGLLIANNGTERIQCAKSTAIGLIGNSTTVDGVVLHFLGCESDGVKGSGCSIKSTGAPAEGLILTNTLKGVLGLSLPHVGTGAALLLLPASGKIWLSLEENKCTSGTKVSGSIAGEVSPINKSQLTSKLVFTAIHPGSSKQNIALFDPSAGGAAVSPELVLFSTTASVEDLVAIEFATATEVT